MYNHHLFLFMTLLLSFISYADELIDDFESGGNINRFNQCWYYFSDVKSRGTSCILNSEVLPNGSYSSLVPVREGPDSGYCAKLEYLLGDTLDVRESYNFIGIGTDIARAGGIADISSAYGVSFRARSINPAVIIFEIVTSNIYDDGYFCDDYLDITNEWKTFTIYFDKLQQPLWARMKADLLLSKVQKMNWKVASYSEYEENAENGCIYLDDVVLLGTTTVSVNYALKHEIKRNGAVNIAGNLLGRQVSVSEHFNRASGIYVMPYRKNLNLNSTLNVPNK
jgi:hypothetical protein